MQEGSTPLSPKIGAFHPDDEETPTSLPPPKRTGPLYPPVAAPHQTYNSPLPVHEARDGAAWTIGRAHGKEALPTRAATAAPNAHWSGSSFDFGAHHPATVSPSGPGPIRAKPKAAPRPGQEWPPAVPSHTSHAPSAPQGAQTPGYPGMAHYAQIRPDSEPAWQPAAFSDQPARNSEEPNAVVRGWRIGRAADFNPSGFRVMPPTQSANWQLIHGVCLHKTLRFNDWSEVMNDRIQSHLAAMAVDPPPMVAPNNYRQAFQLMQLNVDGLLQREDAFIQAIAHLQTARSCRMTYMDELRAVLKAASDLKLTFNQPGAEPSSITYHQAKLRDAVQKQENARLRYEAPMRLQSQAISRLTSQAWSRSPAERLNWQVVHSVDVVVLPAMTGPEAARALDPVMRNIGCGDITQENLEQLGSTCNLPHLVLLAQACLQYAAYRARAAGRAFDDLYMQMQSELGRLVELQQAVSRALQEIAQMEQEWREGRLPPKAAPEPPSTSLAGLRRKLGQQHRRGSTTAPKKPGISGWKNIHVEASVLSLVGAERLHLVNYNGNCTFENIDRISKNFNQLREQQGRYSRDHTKIVPKSFASTATQSENVAGFQWSTRPLQSRRQ